MAKVKVFVHTAKTDANARVMTWPPQDINPDSLKSVVLTLHTQLEQEAKTTSNFYYTMFTTIQLNIKYCVKLKCINLVVYTQISKSYH